MSFSHSEETKRNKTNKLPELLSPAGSPASMMAAIKAGADAVYFGMPEFNARIGADNFTAENIGEYLRACHLMGVKAYVTLNTQIYDRERESFLATARLAFEAGADAAIVGDLGAAELLRKELPDFEIHASTQLSGHNASAGAELSKLGFSRMVIARETSLEDIKTFVEESPVELEIFVHGALCVCHSGQCLFSSLVGGRSGNRGLCAQPCRLPYKIGEKSLYPLSLKDSCLAMHIPEIIESGAASLKIEGRMKPSDYVGRVTAVYRKLLDEGRAATPSEMKYLADIFSRDGFTDRYFTGELAGDMIGIRTDADKERSRALAEKGSDIPERKIGVYMYADIRAGEPMSLAVEIADADKGRYPYLADARVTVKGDVPFEAVNRPTDRALAEKNLVKLGATVFSAEKVEINIDDGLMVPVSALNSLRRGAIEALEELILSPYKSRKTGAFSVERAERKNKEKGRAKKIATFTEYSLIPSEAYRYFDEIYLPLGEFSRTDVSGVNGVMLPAVIFDSELPEVRKMLLTARSSGVKYALVGNVGHKSLAEELGFEVRGDFRLNVSNSHSASAIKSLGFSSVVLSPELTLPKLRDIAAASDIECRAIAYGRIPLMVVEKCVICEGLRKGGKGLCPLKEKGHTGVCRGSLTDRTGASFPVIREFSHRNIIFNSVPVYMADKRSELDRAGLDGHVFIFSDESKEQVKNIISAYESGASADTRVRRIGVQ